MATTLVTNFTNKALLSLSVKRIYWDFLKIIQELFYTIIPSSHPAVIEACLSRLMPAEPDKEARILRLTKCEANRHISDRFRHRDRQQSISTLSGAGGAVRLVNVFRLFDGRVEEACRLRYWLETKVMSDASKKSSGHSARIIRALRRWLPAARQYGTGALVFVLFTTHLCDEKPPPVNPPADVWASFSVEYYRQDSYEAFPQGVWYVQTAYDSVKTRVYLCELSQSLMPARIPFSEASISQYLRICLAADSVYGNCHWERHLVAIEGFLDPTTRLTIAKGGATYCPPYAPDWASLVAVHVIDSFFSASDPQEATSATTIHELGHLATGNSIRDCASGYTPHYWSCVMMDLAEKIPSHTLVNVCASIEFPYTRFFCDVCKAKLDTAKGALYKL